METIEKQLITNIAKTMVQKKEELITSKLDEIEDNWDINKVNCLKIDRVEIFSYNGQDFLEIFPLESRIVNNRMEATFKYRNLL